MVANSDKSEKVKKKSVNPMRSHIKWATPGTDVLLNEDQNCTVLFVVISIRNN